MTSSSTFLDSLVPTSGRPAILRKDGWLIYVCVHDAFYIQELQRLKQDVLDCHPDRRPFTKKGQRQQVHGIQAIVSLPYLLHPTSCTAFFRARLNLTQFVTREKKWYGDLGLTPPGRVSKGIVAVTPSPRTNPSLLEA